MRREHQESLGFVIGIALIIGTLYHFKPEATTAVFIYLIGFTKVVFELTIGFFVMFWDLLR